MAPKLSTHVRRDIYTYIGARGVILRQYNKSLLVIKVGSEPITLKVL